MSDSTWKRVLRTGTACFVGALFLSTLMGCEAPSDQKPAEEEPKQEPAASTATAAASEAVDDDLLGAGGWPKGDGLGIEEGNYVADSGFRPRRDGFRFPNGDRDAIGKSIRYPRNSPGHLDEDGMRRMFGSDKVCLGEQESCVLTPGANEFMNMVNRKMNGGQCEGLAVFALSMWKGYDEPAAFDPSAKIPSDLNREQIRGPVGYYFAYQFLHPFRGYLFGKMRSTTPNKVLDDVIQSFEKKEDPVSLEFFQRGVGGHAVVPYAVEDKGNGLFWVRIWDNNFPGASRYIEFDRNKNTWKYGFGAINPSKDPRAWGGSSMPNTIVAAPVSKRMQDAVCPFCKRDTGYKLLMVTGRVRSLIKDLDGNTLGYENGELVNNIPGAKVHEVLSYMPGQPPPEPIYEVPSGGAYDIQVSSADGEASDAAVGVFGAESALVVEDIAIGKDQQDTVSVTKDGLGIDYKPGAEGRKPKVRLAVGTGKDSYLLKLTDLKAAKGRKMGFRVNRKTLALNVTNGGKATDRFAVKVTRFAKNGKRHVASRKVPSKAGKPGGGGFNFGQLAAGGKALPRPVARKRRWHGPRLGGPGKPVAPGKPGLRGPAKPGMRTPGKPTLRSPGKPAGPARPGVRKPGPVKPPPAKRPPRRPAPKKNPPPPPRRPAPKVRK